MNQPRYDNLRQLYERAFAEYGATALSNRRPVAHPSAFDARSVACALPRESDMNARRLAMDLQAAANANAIPVRRCLLDLIDSGLAGLAVEAAAADVLAANARFNLCFLAQKEKPLNEAGGLTEDDHLAFLERGEADHLECEKIVGQFLNDGDGDRLTLARTLERIASNMNRDRERLAALTGYEPTWLPSEK